MTCDRYRRNRSRSAKDPPAALAFQISLIDQDDVFGGQRLRKIQLRRGRVVGRHVGGRFVIRRRLLVVDVGGFVAGLAADLSVSVDHLRAAIAASVRRLVAVDAAAVVAAVAVFLALDRLLELPE